MWLIFECEIFFSSFVLWIAQLNIATGTVCFSKMSSSNPEASDSPSTRPPMSPAESSVFSVFKMTKGCVMLKVKRHVSIYLYIRVYMKREKTLVLIKLNKLIRLFVNCVYYVT